VGVLFVGNVFFVFFGVFCFELGENCSDFVVEY